MATVPKVRVIGIHRMRVTEEAVNNVIISFGPPTPETRTFVRSFLSRVVLVETLVMDADSTFDAFDIKQPSSSDMLRSFFDAVFLTPDGSDLLVDAGESLPPGHSTFRVAVWFRDWKDNEPLISSYGQCDLPEFTPLPERLERLVPYFSD